MESYDKEDEDEHERLMKEQDKHEKQSINELPNIDDAEYARMIEMSENFGRGDANMEDLEINDDEEEKLPQDMRTELREEHQSISNDEDDEENEEQDGKKRFLSKQKSALIPMQILTRSKYYQRQVLLKEQLLQKIQSRQINIKHHKDIQISLRLVKSLTHQTRRIYLRDKTKMKSLDGKLLSKWKLELKSYSQKWKAKVICFM